MNIWLSAFPDVFSGRCRSFVGRQIFWGAILKCYPNVNLHCRIYHYVLIKEKCALNSAFMFCREQRAVIVNHFLGDKLLCASTDELIESYASQGEGMVQQQKMLDMFYSVLWNGYLARTLRNKIALCQLSLRWSNLQIRLEAKYCKIALWEASLIPDRTGFLTLKKSKTYL